MGEFDFSGWATKNDLKCSDGRIIRANAFKHCDGQTVPLVYNHDHNDVTNILGHALLENRNEGVYAYCSFNDSPEAESAKAAVMHGDINALSIYANQLQQKGSEVLHGAIREVSLVLAGANPGAVIENIYFAHSDEFDEEEAKIWTGETIVLAHSEEAEAEEEPEMAAEEKTVGEVLDELTEEQKDAVALVIGQAVEDALAEAEEDDDEEGENEDMKHNVFENEYADDVIKHSEFQAAVINDGKRLGSMKESFLAHKAEYGIENIDWLFPDAKNLTNQPGFIKRNPDAWVDVVMNGVHHTPFARIKMMFADLREDDARAKGYAVKGKLKKEEVFGLLKRTVEPTTIYKKQKLDRDDVIDITDFDVVAWLKGEMRMMLDEEIARAIIFGDGRSTSSDDKIKETNIIPIVKDAALYTISQTVAGNKAEDIIDAAVIGQNTYEGSGNTTLFMANSKVTELLLIKDTQGRRIYKDLNEVALACAVNKIVKVPDTIVPAGILGVIIDLNDYNIGADKGGAVNMFDDFDIDYNQQKYLIETRCSGALTKPFSAIVIKDAQTQAEG